MVHWQYLLNEKEIQSLCLQEIGSRAQPMELVILASRQQVEELALSKYPNGREGLMADKAYREARAKENYEARLTAYHANMALYDKDPTMKKPTYPRQSKLVNSPIDVNDGGFMVNYVKNHSLCQIGFPSKSDGRPYGDDEDAIYCSYCIESATQGVKVNKTCLMSDDRR